MLDRFTIALVALALFVILAVVPASADYYRTAPIINQGATVYIGETGLDIANATAQANAVSTSAPSTVVGWWASAASITGAQKTAQYCGTLRNGLHFCTNSFEKIALSA